MSRTRKYLHAVAAVYLQQAAMLLAGLWLTRFLLGRMGTDEYGVWLLVMQVFAYLDLIDLGVVAVLPREVAAVTVAPVCVLRTRTVADSIATPSESVTRPERDEFVWAKAGKAKMQAQSVERIF